MIKHCIWLLFPVLFVLSMFPALAQSVKEIQQEIDTKLWTPFQHAFENNDGEALNALYADEVIRVTPAGLDLTGEFKVANIERFAQSKKTNVEVDLDFWFEHRNTLGDASYEVGYFKITRKTGNNQQVIYGQFHIFLRKVKGQWRIAQDWDNNFVRGAKVSESDFKAGIPSRFVD